MKCDENGGCPFRTILNMTPWCVALEIVCDNAACHLTPADFPLINAMIAGTCGRFSPLAGDCGYPVHDAFKICEYHKRKGGDE